MPQNTLYDFFGSAPSNALARAGGQPNVDIRRATPQAVSNGLGAASMFMPSPYGDLAGLAADAIGYAGNPRSLTPLNGLLSLAALAPGVPRGARAAVGGQVAEANGFFYKGGQFLPSTAEAPGFWTVNGKKVKAKAVEVAPGLRELPPTPTAESLYKMAAPGAWTKRNWDTGKLEIVQGVKDANGRAITAETVLSNKGHTLQEIVDAYNSGHRWFDVPPTG